MLFVDLADSTLLAATRPSQELAELLNDLFRLVVAAVDNQRGLINKFEGDADLAVFGAPIQINQPASAALAAARVLTQNLRTLPDLFPHSLLMCRFSPSVTSTPTADLECCLTHGGELVTPGKLSESRRQLVLAVALGPVRRGQWRVAVVASQVEHA